MVTINNPIEFKIKSIECRIVEHPLIANRLIANHSGVHDLSRFLMVMVEDSQGAIGYGEAATTHLWNGESAETAEWVVDNLLAPKLVLRAFFHPEDAMATIDSATFGNPFAKSAIDTAIWDLWAKIQNKSVSSLIGDRNSISSIPTRASVGTYMPKETVRIAKSFWAEGIKTLKFKIGTKGIDDVARLEAVRDALGSEPIFTVDANGAYSSAKEAIKQIESLLKFNITLIEQPTPRDRLGMLAEVKKNLPVPMMIDEGAFTPGHLEEALAIDAFDIISVYPGKNGGFTHSLNMVRRAQQAGKFCAIGCNLETDLGQAAMAVLAASCSAFPLDKISCDLPAAVFYEKSSLQNPLEFKDGNVAVPQGLGFGVEPKFESHFLMQ